MWSMFVCFMEYGSRLVTKGVNDKYGTLHGCLSVLLDLLDKWLASTNVGQLAQPLVNSNRNAFMDPWITAIGTVFAHRRDVLACSRKAARRDPYSTLAVYEYNKKLRTKEEQQCSSVDSMPRKVESRQPARFQKTRHHNLP
ncbi:glutamate synthase [Trichinella spiralis]|uniref:glutamate synthase n=1 Tax=Trichinella spiralis TaxID=6334 RepID=UPI0001EFCA2D|nr:glutamate synthase [Trichinella spiralis]